MQGTAGGPSVHPPTLASPPGARTDVGRAHSVRREPRCVVRLKHECQCVSARQAGAGGQQQVGSSRWAGSAERPERPALSARALPGTSKLTPCPEPPPAPQGIQRSPRQVPDLLRLWRRSPLKRLRVGAVRRHAAVQAGAAWRAQGQGACSAAGGVRQQRRLQVAARKWLSLAGITSPPLSMRTRQETVGLCVVAAAQQPHELAHHVAVEGEV